MKYIIIIFGNYKFKSLSHVQWVCLAEADTSRRCNLLLSPGTWQACELPTSSQDKQVLSVKVVNTYQGRIFLWHQEAPLFKNVPISLPVRGLLRNCYFFNLFYSIFNPNTSVILSKNLQIFFFSSLSFTPIPSLWQYLISWDI